MKTQQYKVINIHTNKLCYILTKKQLLRMINMIKRNNTFNGCYKSFHHTYIYKAI
jgi:hypothetical protein